MLLFDYIAPRHFVVLKIKTIGKGRAFLKGILENCRIVYRRFSIYTFLYNWIVDCVFSVLIATAIFLLFVNSFLIENFGNQMFSVLAKICFFLSMIVIYPVIDLCRNLLLLDKKASKKIRQIISRNYKQDREREKRIRQSGLSS